MCLRTNKEKERDVVENISTFYSQNKVKRVVIIDYCDMITYGDCVCHRCQYMLHTVNRQWKEPQNKQSLRHSVNKGAKWPMTSSVSGRSLRVAMGDLFQWPTPIPKRVATL